MSDQIPILKKASNPNFTIGLRLSFWDLPCAPDAITECLGIRPTRIGIKGAPRYHEKTGARLRDDLVVKHNYWVLKSKDDKECSIDEQWLEMQHMLVPKKPELIELGKKYHIIFSCIVWSYKYQPGLLFPPSMLQFLADIGAELEIDPYPSSLES